jgi:D-alanyl-D-alanine dipeptidase
VVPANGHGLPVVKRSETYRQQVLLARDASVVDVAAFVPQLRLELAYATRQNPTGRVLYDARRAYLRLPVALALRGVQRELGRQGIGLLVFDAYRPYSATLALWQAVRDPAYAAPPSSGSRHNRGAAVDVALVDLQTGKPLRMPTPYDTFSVKAHHGYLGLPAQVIARRELLRAVMTRHGFTALAEEWWHYDYVGWRDFAVMDLPLGVLAAARPRFDVWLQYPPAGRVAVLLPPR